MITAKTTDTFNDRLRSTVQRTALAQDVAGGIDALVPPLVFLTRILELPEDEAQEILECANHNDKTLQTMQKDRRCRSILMRGWRDYVSLISDRIDDLLDSVF